MKVIHNKSLIAVLFVFALLAGCSPATAPAISVEGAWGRPSATMPTAGGMYMLIRNTGTAADRLMSGSSPACGSIEVHQMVMQADGTMGMNLVDSPVEIPAGGQVELKVGALHIMCIMKNESFVPGATINLTLKFEKTGEVVVPVELRAE
jgi:copper(I)-binding protein